MRERERERILILIIIMSTYGFTEVDNTSPSVKTVRKNRVGQ